MILDFIREYGAWTWVIGGLVLIALELVIPGSLFVWMGIAAVLTGVFGLFVASGWQIQILVFAAASALLVLGGRRVFSREHAPGERPFLNDRARKLVGTMYVLEEPIVDGRGRIRVADTQWRVSGPDLPSGTRVRVAAADGAQLTVEPVEPAEQDA